MILYPTPLAGSNEVTWPLNNDFNNLYFSSLISSGIRMVSKPEGPKPV